LKYAQDVLALAERFRERGVIPAAAPGARLASEIRGGGADAEARSARSIAPEVPSRR
jgi:hypothetical protein